MSQPPAERSLQNRRAAQLRWAKETPTRAHGQRAQAGHLAKYRREVAEHARAKGETLTDAELDRRALSLRDAYLSELALRSVRSRKAKAATRRTPPTQAGDGA